MSKLDQFEKLFRQFVEDLEGDGYEELTCLLEHGYDRRGKYLIIQIHDPKEGEE